MVSLLAALICVAQQPGVLVEPPIPMPVPVEIGKPISFAIRRISKPIDPQKANKDGSLDWTIHGKVVHIPRHTKGWSVWRAYAGKDGSLLCSEMENVYDGPDRGFLIKHPRQKKLIATAYVPGQHYLDARTSIYEMNWDLQDSPLGSTFGPPELHVQKDKVDRYYGLGDDVAVWSADEILTTIPIDDRGVPCVREFVNSWFLRFYLRGKPIEIGRCDYLGALSDHTLLLWHVDLSPDRTGLFDWRLGKFLRGRELPRAWKPIVVNSRGDILLRKDPGDYQEWEVAILRGNVMTPIEFVRPAGTEKLFWETEPTFDDKDTIVFNAYYRAREEFYALTPVRV